MQSKTYFRGIVIYDVKSVAKSLVSLGLLALLVFTVLIPVSTSLIHDISVFNINYTHQQLKFQFFAENALIPVNVAAVLIGMATGIKLFAFITDKRRSAFMFSLGMSRKKLYCVRIAAGTAMLLISIFLPMMISLALNEIALGRCEGMVAYGLSTSLGIFLQAMASFIIFVASCFVSGTMTEVLVTGITILAAPSAVLYAINVLMKNFMWGNVSGAYTYGMAPVGESLLDKLFWLNPIFFNLQKMEETRSFSREMSNAAPENINWIFWAAWVLVLTAAIICAGMMFNRYKAEKSGISGLFPVSDLCVMLIWPVCAAAVCLDIVCKINVAAGAVSAVFCFALISVIIMEMSVHAGRTRKITIAGGTAAAVMLVISSVLVYTGLFGLAYRIPAVSDISAVEITYAGQPSLAVSKRNITLNKKALYSDSTVELTSAEGVELASNLDKLMQKQGKRAFKSSQNPEDTIYPYDIKIIYKLKSGKNVERYYDRITAGNIAEFLELENEDEVRRQTENIIKGANSVSLWNSEAFLEGEIYVTDCWYSSVKQVSVSGEKRSLLLAAIAEDMTNQALSDRYYSDENQAGIIFFSLNGESDTADFMTNSANATVYLTNEFQKTLALLSEWKIDFSETVPEVESIQIQKFDPYATMNGISRPISLVFSGYRSESQNDFILEQDFGTRPQITEQERIEKIVPSLRTLYFMDGGGYLAAIKLKGSNYYIYKFIPYEAAPDFIKSKM